MNTIFLISLAFKEIQLSFIPLILNSVVKPNVSYLNFCITVSFSCSFSSRSAQTFRKEDGRWWKIQKVEWDHMLTHEISGSHLTMQAWSDTNPTLFAAWAWVAAWSGPLILTISEILVHVNPIHYFVPSIESSEVTLPLEWNVISLLTIPRKTVSVILTPYFIRH
jgi:hypothetical protein